MSSRTKRILLYVGIGAGVLVSTCYACALHDLRMSALRGVCRFLGVG